VFGLIVMLFGAGVRLDGSLMLAGSAASARVDGDSEVGRAGLLESRWCSRHSPS